MKLVMKKTSENNTNSKLYVLQNSGMISPPTLSKSALVDIHTSLTSHWRATVHISMFTETFSYLRLSVALKYMGQVWEALVGSGCE